MTDRIISLEILNRFVQRYVQHFGVLPPVCLESLVRSALFEDYPILECPRVRPMLGGVISEMAAENYPDTFIHHDQKPFSNQCAICGREFQEDY